MPEEILSWFIDSALLAGVNEGSVTLAQANRCPECPEPEVVIVEIIEEVPVEREVERIVYVEKPFTTVVEKIVEK